MKPLVQKMKKIQVAKIRLKSKKKIGLNFLKSSKKNFSHEIFIGIAQNISFMSGSNFSFNLLILVIFKISKKRKIFFVHSSLFLFNAKYFCTYWRKKLSWNLSQTLRKKYKMCKKICKFDKKKCRQFASACCLKF